MKLVLGLFGLLLLIVIIGTYSKNTLFPNGGFLNFNNNSPATVAIDNQTFTVDEAKTQAQQEQGLSGKSSMAQNHGMLFIFDTPGKYAFWMRGMKFPLDIIFMDNGKIVTIDKNLQPPAAGTPDNQLSIYAPTQNVDKVLEINAGLANKYNFKVGDSVTYNNL